MKKGTAFWIIFMKDSRTGVIHGTAHPHNATADYKDMPSYIGTQLIFTDLKKLEKSKQSSENNKTETVPDYRNR